MASREKASASLSAPPDTSYSTPTLGRVSLNSFWLLAARVLSLGLGLLFSGLLARALGEAGLGQFAFISALVFVGNAASTFGLDTLLQRDVAAARASAGAKSRPPLGETTSAVLLIQLAISAAYVAILWLVAPRLPNQSPATLPALWLAALALIPLAFSTVYSAILRAYERMALYLGFTLVTAAIMAAGGALLLVAGDGLTAAAGVVLAAQTGGALAAAWLCGRSVPVRWQWAWPSRVAVRRALRLGSALAALMLLSVLYQRSGLLLLSLLGGDAAAGAYSAAARVIEALKLLPGAFFGAMFPVMARAEAVGSSIDDTAQSSRRLYSRAFVGLLAASVALAACASALAPVIVRLLFGPGYEAAASALRVMAWSLPATVVTFRLSFDLVICGRERVAATSMALTLLVSGGLTAFLIARAGLAGAAWGLVAGEVAQVLILVTLTRLASRTESR